MSRGLKPIVYVDEDVSSIDSAREKARRAESRRQELHGELLALIMATPKDVAAPDDDPIDNIKSRFENIWEELWDAFVDDYKYTAIADDAEFSEDSLVVEQWKEEEKDREELRKENEKRTQFFQKHKDVLSPYNFDDYTIYDEWKSGNIVIPEPFTKSDRIALLEDIKAKTQEMLKEAVNKIKAKKDGE